MAVPNFLPGLQSFQVPGDAGFRRHDGHLTFVDTPFRGYDGDGNGPGHYKGPWGFTCADMTIRETVRSITTSLWVRMQLHDVPIIPLVPG